MLQLVCAGFTIGLTGHVARELTVPLLTLCFADGLEAVAINYFLVARGC